MMILGPDGAPLTTKQIEDEKAVRVKELCEKVYAIFMHESATFEEGADVGANLQINMIRNAQSVADGEKMARALVQGLVAAFQSALKQRAQHEKVKATLGVH